MGFFTGTAPDGAGGPASDVRGRRRTRAGVALAVFAFVVAPVSLHLLARTDAARAALTARVAGYLASRLPEARLVGAAHVDWALRLVAGPITLPGRAPGAPPVVTLEQVRLRPSLTALLRGRLEPGSILLDGVQIEAGPRGEALLSLVRDLRERRGERGRLGAAGGGLSDLVFRGLQVRAALARGPRSRTLELGPFSGAVELRGEGEHRETALRLRLPGGGSGEVVLAGSGALRAELRGRLADDVPAAILARLPYRPTSGLVRLEAMADRLGDPGAARFGLEVSDLAVRWDQFGPEAVGPVALRLRGELRWELARASLELEGGKVELGPGQAASAALSGVLQLGGDARLEVEVEAAADQVDWEALLAALPPQLRPPPEAPALRGRLAGRLRVSGPLREPAAWSLEGDVDPSGLAPAPRTAGALDLARPFTWRAPLPGGGTRDLEVGPARARFVSLAALPAHVVRAVLLSEDAGFYGHHGFDLAEIREAVARAGGGRRLRGASTITQQLAKNLFLSPERTLARKGREALATLALEASLPKRRLLEIYLNVAEWGSGVNGIGEAAWHWFGKDARELSPKEAAFLATVIPNPVRYEMYLRRGALTDNAEARVRDLLLKLRAADVLSEAQLYEAWWAPLAFARG